MVLRIGPKQVQRVVLVPLPRFMRMASQQLPGDPMVELWGLVTGGFGQYTVGK